MAHYRRDRFPEAARELAGAAGPVPLGPLASLAAIARQLADFGDEPPYRVAGPDCTRLELAAVDPLPAVELSVNGGAPALFLVDTGGAELIVDERLAASAGARLVAAMKAEYAGRRRARTGLGRVDSVEAGGLRVEAVPVHTLDLGPLRDFFGLDVRGIVGTRFLMHFLVTIDYRGGALILRREDSSPEPNEGISFWLAELHLILARGRLGGQPPTLFWVDTGLAASGFLAREATLRAAGVPVDWSQAREGPGGGGLATETDVLIESVTLGDGESAVTRRDVPGTVLAKPPSILGERLGFEVGGLISHAFFKAGGALTLDFSRMRLVIGSPG